MEKAQSERRIFLIAGAASCVVSVVTMALVVVLWYKTLYVFMGVMLALSIASIYAIPFTFFAAHEAALAMRIIPIFESNGELPDSERIEKTAEDIGWKTAATEKFLRKCKKRHYIEI